MSKEEILAFYRRVLDHIHAFGDIFYDAGRYKAYMEIARLASELRRAA